MPLGYIVLEWITADVKSVLRKAFMDNFWKLDYFVVITKELSFTF